MYEKMSDWMNEWKNEWINEWMDGWLNEWMNERISEWMNECASSVWIIPQVIQIRMNAGMSEYISNYWRKKKKKGNGWQRREKSYKWRKQNSAKKRERTNVHTASIKQQNNKTK